MEEIQTLQTRSRQSRQISELIPPMQVCAAEEEWRQLQQIQQRLEYISTALSRTAEVLEDLQYNMSVYHRETSHDLDEQQAILARMFQDE